MQDDSALERLSKRLDAGKNEQEQTRSGLYTSYTGAPQSWKPDVDQSPMSKKPKMKPLEILFASSVVFFVVASAVAALLFLGGNNTVSTKNVSVQVSGPAQIGAGSTLSLQVVVTNKNAVPMELTDLIVEFPEGTRSDFDIGVELPRIRESLGTIQPGESVNRTIRAVLFGLQGTNATIKASAEYRVPSSNAVFVSGSTYSVNLNESPAVISVETLKEASAGQEVTFGVSIRSNAPDVLSDMLLLASYPPGFSFLSANPKASAGTTAWELGDIEPGGSRTVLVTGTFSGEDGESKVVKFSAGNKKQGEVDKIAAPLATSDVSLTLRKPFMSLEITVDGKNAETHSVSRGGTVRGTVQWMNNLPNRVQNVVIVLTLNGVAIDPTSIRSQNGFYNSNINSITWDKTSAAEYSDVGPGEFGSEQFTFQILPANRGPLKNAEVLLTANVKANRLTETNVPEAIESSDSTKVLVLTDFILNTVAVPTGGAIPPKAGAETQYLVTWNVSNSGNAIANGVTTGVLPSYVTYVDARGSDSVTYNAGSRTVSWDIGDVAVGQSKTASFIVSLLPSVSQVGQAPELVINQRAVGVDRFVRQNVESSAPNLRTAPSGGSSSSGIVVP
ncbi:DUF11 domain-containing protein [Patescibacteria group bacterium]|nr:DUF11 domain-containing protein [Patescibacteria group bacterium]